jgi:ribosomal protein L13E
MAIRAKVVGHRGWRNGKGFSTREVAMVANSLGGGNEAVWKNVDTVIKKLDTNGIRRDLRRRSSHAVNVQALKTLFL